MPCRHRDPGCPESPILAHVPQQLRRAGTARRLAAMPLRAVRVRRAVPALQRLATGMYRAAHWGFADRRRITLRPAIPQLRGCTLERYVSTPCGPCRIVRQPRRPGCHESPSLAHVPQQLRRAGTARRLAAMPLRAVRVRRAVPALQRLATGMYRAAHWGFADRRRITLRPAVAPPTRPRIAPKFQLARMAYLRAT